MHAQADAKEREERAFIVKTYSLLKDKLPESFIIACASWKQHTVKVAKRFNGSLLIFAKYKRDNSGASGFQKQDILSEDVGSVASKFYIGLH